MSSKEGRKVRARDFGWSDFLSFSFKGIFANGLTDPYSLEVRLASLRGAVAFLQDASTDVRNGSTELMTGILGVRSSLSSLLLYFPR